MNPTTAVDPTVPPPAQPPRSSFSCDRHPTELFNGFCPSCLYERLTTLDIISSNTPSSSRRPSSAIKALFSSKPPKPSNPNSILPELRRSKSFSASKNEALGLIFEPQRKSCDVRVRNTLWSLFTLDDDGKFVGGGVNCCNYNKSSSVLASTSHQNPQNSVKFESCVANNPVFEETEAEEDCIEAENADDGFISFVDDDEEIGDEIRPISDSNLVENSVKVEVNPSQIVEEQEVSISSLKPMKDHIDLDSQEKKSSGGGGFWGAASGFSKKWQKWRHKQKVKKQNNGGNLATLPVEKPISRQFRETQSEIADYGFGRRSCDIDPRFSLDAGRISLDDPRYLFDEPRASWDGHMIGRRSFSRMAPPMVSVLEDAPAVRVPRTDMQMQVEEQTNGNLPGGSVQTREYYLDSSSRRRKSLDRSSSIRKTAASVVAEIDELKNVSNARVSPTTADYFHDAKVLVSGRELRDSNANYLRDDYSETFNGFRDSNASVIPNGERKESKKSRRWSWKIWNFMNRGSNGSKDADDDDEKYSRVNGVARSLSESWQDSRREVNGNVQHPRYNGNNMFRSNSSVSWRNGNPIGTSMRNSVVEKKKRDEFVFERNRSARYSPNSHVDKGLLRFYLTPLRSSRRGRPGKIKMNGSQSITRSVLRLY